MKLFLTITASLATIATIGFASYGIGNTESGDTPRAVEVTIHNAISGLPQSEQSSAKELLAPILAIIGSNSDEILKKDDKKIKKYGAQLKENLEKYSLTSYQAGKSPFVPPKQKTLYFCSNNFRFSYKGLMGVRDFKCNPNRQLKFAMSYVCDYGFFHMSHEKAILSCRSTF